MINREIKQKIEEEARSFFEGASGCHDWTHVDRVKNLALKIGQGEGANLDVIEVASLLHDIGRKEEMNKKGEFCHAERGAELARDILDKYDIEREHIENILHCIATHRFRRGNIPETIEAKVIFDADKIDGIGAIGVARDFLFAGSAGSNCLYTGNEREIAQSNGDHSYTEEDTAILEYEIKLKHVKNKIITQTGKAIAEARHKFMEDYFDRFWREVEGEL